MKFWPAFLRLLSIRPLLALEALYWHTTRRKVRAGNRLRAGLANSRFAYLLWISDVECLDTLAKRVNTIIDRWPERPCFSVLIMGDRNTSPDDARRTQASIETQYYPAAEIIIGSDCSHGGLQQALADAQGDYLVPVHMGDRLSPAALYRYAEAAQSARPVILYGDEDRMNARGDRCSPWFKPQWNIEMLLAQDYVTAACAVRLDAVRAVAGKRAVASIYGLILALTEHDEAKLHVPHILVHRSTKSRQFDQQLRIGEVAEHLRTTGADIMPGDHDTVRVSWPLPETPPTVTIIVPTRDKADLLRTCVDGVLSLTVYPHFDVIIVDNGSVEPETHICLQELAIDPRVSILSYPAPYNYSDINNHAARHATGEYLCLLNNDTEIVDGEWLKEMMRQAVRPHVGAVGAKLLYADGSIQHAGVVIGIGNAAGHAHRHLPQGERGYFAQAHVAGYASAVTAACLVVEKRKFDAVGGLDAEHLAIAYNDVDLCLKLEAAGWRNIYTPHAVLLHHESKSRGQDLSETHIARYREELAFLQGKWGTTTYVDPLHNPNLDRASETFTIRVG